MTTTMAPGRHRRADPPRPPHDGPPRGRLSRLLLGSVGQPGHTRPALLVLLAGTAVLYLWNLAASGYANSFYAAAVQAGTMSWKALLFGSLDPGNAITVDKPPASLWVMALSGRIFGFSSWSLLVPQALAGVASVALLYATVRRWSGPAAGLLAGTALALTPVAALMFRFDNPDALLVLLMVAGAHCVVRATERAQTGWLVLAGVALGFGFLTKMLQAFLVLPAFALVYLVAAPAAPLRRVTQVLIAGVALVGSAGWYVVLVTVWPTSSRPYIGGSSHNSLLELAVGYNGIGRVFGGAGNGGFRGVPPGGGPPGGGGFGGNLAFGGTPGLGRLFGESMGTEISWLLPAALIGLVAELWFTRRAPRTHRTRAALLLWGGWLVVTGVVFSYMQGTVHPYYAVALAPPIAAIVAVAGRALWRGRCDPAARGVLAAMIAVTGGWDWVLLARTPSWLPALRWLVLGAGLAVAGLVLLGGHRLGRLTAVLATAAVLSVAAGTSAYAVDTAATPHNGPLPSSGPSTGGFGGRGGGPPAGGPGSGRRNPSGLGGGMGGPGRDGEASSNGQLTAALRATDTRWAAATTGARAAASLQLATGRAVMAVGGFTGNDPFPTLAQFQQDVSAGEIRYFVGGGTGGPDGGAAGQIAGWVAEHFTGTTIGGQTVYDLTKPTS